MKRTKRILSMVLVIVMLFTSLPVNAFAQETTSPTEVSITEEEATTMVDEGSAEEVTEGTTAQTEESTNEAASEPVYEKFSEYTVNGVRYRTQSNYAEVLGAGENMPADVVIPEKIGKYYIKSILNGAFDNCKELKSIVIPKYVNSIAGLKNTGLEKAEILGSAIDIKFGAFRDCPLFENEENWKNDLLIVSNALIAGRGSEELHIGKEITTIAQGCFGQDSEIPKITFENLKFCFQAINRNTFGKNTVLKGKVGSDAERYAETFGNPFEYYCTCENQQVVEATKTYCNGTVGYSEGVWCETCGVWISGHKKITEFSHLDENEDGICDYCELSTDEKIIDSGVLNQTVYWCKKEDGTVLFFGTGKITMPLRDFHKFINIVIGGDIDEIDAWAFSHNNYLESVVFGENIKTIGQTAFYDCPNLSRVEFEGKYVDIKPQAFGKTSFINDESNYKDGLLVVSGCLISCQKRGYIVLDDSIHSIAASIFHQGDRIIIENPDCLISKIHSGCSIMGLEGSTAEKYAKDNSLTFYPLCLCEDTTFVEGKPSLCDGTLNYEDGQWCEKCNIWKSGHSISSEIKHSETLINGVCTICGETVPESDKIIDSGVLENGVWILQNESELVIYGSDEIGKPKDEQENAKWYYLTNDNKVKKITVKGTVRKIGNALFSGMTSVESVKLENGITEIGESAFENCNNLKNIELSNILISIGKSAFEGCKKLQLPAFPDTLYKIGERAFAACSSFESLVLPDSIEYIEEYAFSNCGNLAYLKLPEDAITCGDYAFYNCRKLKTADLAGLELVKEGMFRYCTALETVTASGVIYTRYQSFAYCSALTTFPWNRVKNIGEESFMNCTSLTEVNLDCPGRIDDFAFSGCTALKKVTMSSATRYFVGLGIFENCTALESVTLAKGLKKIPQQMFKNCKSLKTIEMPSSLTTVGVSAFRNCTGFTEIVLGENISEIKAKAFDGCTNLIKMTVSNNNIAIADVYTENGKEYPSIPKTTVLWAAVGSETHKFALEQGYTFKGIDASEEPVEIEIITPPTKNVYYASEKPTKIDTNGTVLRIHFINGAYVDLEDGFTVDVKDTDLTKPGTYNPAIIYKGYEAIFTVTVIENEEKPDTPPEEENKIIDFTEGSVLDFDGRVYDTICFIPKETRTYYFVLENANTVTIRLPDGTGKSFLKDSFNYSFVAGETYLITYSKNAYITTLRLRETDIFDSEILPDGTIRIRYYMGSENNLTIPSEIGGRSVTKIGEEMFFLQNSLTSVKIPSTIKSIEKDAFRSCRNLTEIDMSEATSLEYIGEGAFGYCDSLESITFPSSVKEIGDGAFAYCKFLKTVVFGESDIAFEANTFYACKNLQSVTLPEGLTSISDYMFRNCTSLTELKLNGALKEIGYQAFCGCTGLETLIFPDSLEEIGENAFNGCQSIKEVVIPEKVTVISNSSFEACRSLEKACIKGENVKIESDAFERCYALKEIIFENSVSEIGRWAFWRCESLESIDLGDSLSKIDSWAFEECTALKEITLPESLTEAGSSVFTGCSSLKKVTVLGDVTSIGPYCFKNCISLESINIPQGVSVIGVSAFENTKLNIESLKFTESVEIGDNAFMGCTGIKSVSIPEYSTIGASAFADNINLIEVTVGNNSIIGNSAFKGCIRLEEFDITEGTEILKNALDGCRNLKKITIRNSMMPKSSLGSIPLNVEIYAIKDSYGEKYAIENNYTYFELPGHAHTFSIETIGEKKCLTEGKEIYTCECGYTYEKIISSFAHKYKNFEIEKEPTCTEPGIKTRHCYCGKTRAEITVIPPLGHTEVIDIPAVAPTETSPGYTHQSHCSVCGETVVKRELIGHSEYDIKINNETVIAHKFNAATNDKDGENTVIIFEQNNDIYLSYIDKTVIYKVGEVSLSKTEFVYNGKNQTPLVTVKDSKGEALVLNRDYKLTYPSVSKYCGKYSVTVDYIGNYAGSKTLNYDIVINAVNPFIAMTSADSLTLSWDKGHSDLVYRVYSVNSKGNLTQIADTKDGSYRVSALKSGSEHRFLVWAYVKDENGKVYWGKQGNTLLYTTNPAKVEGLSAYAKTSSAKLSWTEVSGASGYCVYMYDGSWKMIKDTKSLSCEVSGLKSGTGYKFYVRAYKKIAGKILWGPDSKSDAVQVYTKPSATKKVTYKSYNDSIKISWDKVTGATGYRIYVYDSSRDKYVKVADTAKTSYTVKKNDGKKLKSGVKYKFRIKAYMEKNDKTHWSESYASVSAATKPAKTTLSVTSSNGKAYLSWKNVSGESGYQVYYATKKDGKYKKLTTTKANKLKYSKKLAKGKKYYFKVRAYKKVNGKTIYGSFSTVKSVKIK